MARRTVVDYPAPVAFLPLKDGGTVAYVRMGAGSTTLLFVHGLASYIPVWQKNLPPLAQFATCIAVDLPGYGQSRLTQKPSLVYYAEVIAEVITTLQLKNVVLIGHSMGGQIGTIAALRTPWLLTKLVLIAPAGFEVYSEEDKERLRKQFETFPVTSIVLLRYYNRALNHNPIGSVPQAQRAHVLVEADTPEYARTLARCILAMLREPVHPYLEQLTVPTLVIFGDDDGLIPNRSLQPGLTTEQLARTATARIPKARLALVPGGGHFVQYEYPLVVADHIEQFADLT